MARNGGFLRPLTDADAELPPAPAPSSAIVRLPSHLYLNVTPLALMEVAMGKMSSRAFGLQLEKVVIASSRSSLPTDFQWAFHPARSYPPPEAVRAEVHSMLLNIFAGSPNPAQGNSLLVERKMTDASPFLIYRGFNSGNPVTVEVIGFSF